MNMNQDTDMDMHTHITSGYHGTAYTVRANKEAVIALNLQKVCS